MNYRVLVCDDDPAIARAIGIYLRAAGYEALEAHDGLEALELCQQQTIHLIIMDIMMPGMDGMRATEILRQTQNIPVIMLSAKSEDVDKIDGLTVGADDYVTKPFNPAELMARVKSQLRRYTSLGGMSEPETTAKVYRTGELVIDDASKTVTVDGEPISLTPREYGILCFLTQHAGQVFSISQIYEAVWSEPAYNPENTVAVHIRRIREKIEINPKDPKYVKVVWGIGYKVEKLHPKQLG
ncbi:MAG: response regulator transcription factor [Eubacteriales bacterium]|nr:response regulator transcription factor [Eubacteriales bacterium]